jgi:hypothetical protein
MEHTQPQQDPVKLKGRPQKKDTVLSKLKSAPVVQTEDPSAPSTPSTPVVPVAPKVKKPLTEAQKSNLQKMLAANKARREQNQTPVAPLPPPQEVRTVHVDAKKKRVLPQPPPSQPPHPPQNDALMDMLKRFDERLNLLTSKKDTKLKTTPVLKPSSVKKPRKFQQETSEEEEEYEEDSDAEYVQKYAKKAEKRIQAVRQIEAQLSKAQPPRSKYDGMSLF